MPLIDSANTFTLKIKPSDIPLVQTRQNIQNCALRTANSDVSKNSPKKKKQQNRAFQNQINRLKISLSDREFDLKKLSQDFAQQKKHLVCEVTRLKNQNKNLAKQAKQRLQQEVQYWAKKIQTVKQQQVSELNEQKKLLQRNFDLQSKIHQQELQQDYKNAIEKLQEEIQAQKQQQQIKIANQRSYHEKNIEKLKITNEQYRTIQQKQFYNVVQNLKREHQSQINFYQESLKSKDRQIKQFQNVYKGKIGNCEQLLIERHKTINLKNQQINALNQKVKCLMNEKEDFRLDKIFLQRKLAKLEDEYQDKYQQKVKQVNQKLQLQTEQMQIFYTNAAQEVQNKLNTLTQLSKHKENLLQERSVQLLAIFRTNKSKEEDLKRIQSLELKLIKKQFQLEHQQEQLKTCKLQLNNMDKMYQKVFQQAKMKAFKSRKLKLPSLMNRSTMDCYDKSMKDYKKQLKQNINYLTKDVKQVCSRHDAAKQLYE